jgi:hypothetical protein
MITERLANERQAKTIDYENKLNAGFSLQE